MQKLQQELNPSQFEAVTHQEGPLLILAGAGSGKTRVITYRIVHLIRSCGVHPSQILALTFTNKAAREMKERVAERLGENSFLDSPLLISTFHSACLKFLKWKHEKEFVVYDPTDQQMLIKNIYKELGIDIKDFSPKKMLGKISGLKNDFISPEEYQPRFMVGPAKLLYEVYPRYQKKLQENNAFDFDDLICETVRMLQEKSDILRYFTDRFQYIMIDEYQDTNKAQYLLIKALTKHHNNICVVGDDDQSIYKWRGASIENILRFEHDFPGCKVVKLEENYRSTRIIISAAGEMVANNTKRKEKKVFARKKEGERIKILLADDEHEESKGVALSILKRKEAGGNFGDCAVFYRTNAQSRVYEDTFRMRNIPYVLVGGTKFYERKEIKDMLAYLRLILNRSDDISFQRVVNFPRRKIGATTLSALTEYADTKGVSLFHAVLSAEKEGTFKKGTIQKLLSFCTLIERMEQECEEMLPSDIIALVYRDTGFEEELKSIDAAGKTEKVENLLEFVTVAQEFQKQNKTTGKEGIRAFLDELSLSDSLDESEEAGRDNVTLMTLHSSKGLEFPFVFLTGMEEGLLPHYISSKTEEDVEEERRLCYVGMTRAKEVLTLSCARRRHIFGQFYSNPQSRFLLEIPKENADIFHTAFDLQNGRSLRFPQETTQQKRRENITPQGSSNRAVPVRKFPQKASQQELQQKRRQLRKGEKIMHQLFGKGEITGISETSGKWKIAISFETEGDKTFLLNDNFLQALS